MEKISDREGLDDKKMEIWMKLMNLGARLGCHQKPERSLFIKGYQLPLCSRCTGVVIGYLLGVFIAFQIPDISWTFVGLCLPMAIDGFTQYVGLRSSTQPLRLITGLIGGMGLMLIQIKVLRMIMEVLL